VGTSPASSGSSTEHFSGTGAAAVWSAGGGLVIFGVLPPTHLWGRARRYPFFNKQS
jgi:hypothetical protein